MKDPGRIDTTCRKPKAHRNGESGQALVEHAGMALVIVAILTAVAFAIRGPVVDLGRALVCKIEEAIGGTSCSGPISSSSARESPPSHTVESSSSDDGRDTSEHKISSAGTPASGTTSTGASASQNSSDADRSAESVDEKKVKQTIHEIQKDIGGGLNGVGHGDLNDIRKKFRNLNGPETDRVVKGLTDDQLKKLVEELEQTSFVGGGGGISMAVRVCGRLFWMTALLKLRIEFRNIRKMCSLTFQVSQKIMKARVSAHLKWNMVTRIVIRDMMIQIMTPMAPHLTMVCRARMCIKER